MDFFSIHVIAAIIAAAAGFVVWLKRRGAGNWPMITGIVEQTCVNQDGRRYAPGILYSCQVNSEFYSGQYRLSGSFNDYDEALELAKGWLEKKVYIRYKPSDPQVSVLLPDDRPPV